MSDYEVQFAAGETSQTIEVDAEFDDEIEETEEFSAKVYNTYADLELDSAEGPSLCLYQRSFL